MQQKNKINKLKLFATSPELAIFDMLHEINTKLEKTTKVLDGLNLSEFNSIKEICQKRLKIILQTMSQNK